MANILTELNKIQGFLGQTKQLGNSVKNLTNTFSRLFGGSGGGSSDGFNINEFRAKINKTGVLKNNLFLVYFPMPNCLSKVYGQSTKDLFFYTKSTSLPGVGMDYGGDYVRRYGYGPAEKYAYLPIFNDISITFMLDGQGFNRKFFDNWASTIVNFYNPDGISASTNRISGYDPYEVEYKENYVVDLTITVFDETNDKILFYTLKDAFPVSIETTPLDWERQNEMATAAISFAYRDWYSDSVDGQTTNINPPPNNATFNIPANYGVLGITGGARTVPISRTV